MIVAFIDWAIFQSTLPVWGATIFDGQNYRVMTISIHAPRVGSDLLFLQLKCR